MDEVKKMLRAVINGQSAMKQELLVKIEKVDERANTLEGKIDSLGESIKKGFKEVNKRIDKIGSQLAYLEEDAPTRDEHDNLEKRVDELEGKTTSL